MESKNKQYPVPEFQSLEEEERYWQSHSPLMEGYKGKVQRRNQPRESFLTIRLTGDELAELRQTARQYGLGPSTYARQLLIQGMKSSGKRFIPPQLLMNLFKKLAHSADKLQTEESLRIMTEYYNAYLQSQEDWAEQIARMMEAVMVLDHISEFEESRDFKEMSHQE